MEYEIEKALLRGDSSLLIKISDSMLRVARILKGKGGSNDTELKEKIMKYKVWEGTDGLEGQEEPGCVFGEVYSILWGPDDGKDGDASLKRDYEQVESDGDDVGNAIKRVREVE